MLMNHHILAKTTTDSVLRKFKSEEWTCYNGIGKNFFRVTTDASFPSPDAAFFDEENKFLVSFEFKPPTESKRGILTGLSFRRVLDRFILKANIRQDSNWFDSL